ncbi:hypothetical protein D3C86_1782470 [compost metagenome]
MAEGVAAQAGPPLVAQRGAVEGYGAAHAQVVRQQAEGALQQQALALAAAPHQRHYLAGGQLQVDVAEQGLPAAAPQPVVAGRLYGDVVEAQHRSLLPNQSCCRARE